MNANLTQLPLTDPAQILRYRDRQYAAELLAAAIVQLLRQGNSADVENLTQQALGWFKGESKDPGCPRH